MIRVYKPTVESFAEEAINPVYCMTIQKVQSSNDKFQIPFYRPFISVTALNQYGSILEFRCLIGSCFAEDRNRVREINERGRAIQERIKHALAIFELREGCISDEPILGELPEEEKQHEDHPSD